MRKSLSAVLVLVSLLLSFKCTNQKTTQMTKAKIVFSGLVAADGCGWLLEVEGEEYSPVEISEDFKKDGLKVDVELSYLETGFQCGMNPDYKIPQVKIIQIKHLSE